MITKGFDYLGLATSSLVTVLLFQRYGITAKTLFVLPLAFATGPLFLIDATTMRLPNSILYPAISLVSTISVGYAIYTGNISNLTGTLIKGSVFFLVFLLLYFLTRGGIGAGDAKLAALIGLSLGIYPPGYLFLILMSSFIIAALYSLVLLGRRKATLKSKVAFGPFLLIATWVCVLLPSNTFI